MGILWAASSFASCSHRVRALVTASGNAFQTSALACPR